MQPHAVRARMVSEGDVHNTSDEVGYWFITLPALASTFSQANLKNKLCTHVLLIIAKS